MILAETATLCGFIAVPAADINGFLVKLHDVSQLVPRNRRVSAGENDCRRRPKMPILGDFTRGGRIE
jgi:hypothetical protein